MDIEDKMTVIKDSINRIINTVYGIYDDGIINEIFDLENLDIMNSDRFTSWTRMYNTMLNAISEIIRQSYPINSEVDMVKIKTEITALTEKLHNSIPGIEYKYSVSILASYTLGIFDINWLPNTNVSYVEKILNIISPMDEEGRYDIDISYKNILEINKYSDEELKLYFKFK